jgi:hypothetical protein
MQQQANMAPSVQEVYRQPSKVPKYTHFESCEGWFDFFFFCPLILLCTPVPAYVQLKDSGPPSIQPRYRPLVLPPRTNLAALRQRRGTTTTAAPEIRSRTAYTVGNTRDPGFRRTYWPPRGPSTRAVRHGSRVGYRLVCPVGGRDHTVRRPYELMANRGTATLGERILVARERRTKGRDSVPRYAGQCGVTTCWLPLRESRLVAFTLAKFQPAPSSSTGAATGCQSASSCVLSKGTDCCRWSDAV